MVSETQYTKYKETQNTKKLNGECQNTKYCLDWLTTMFEKKLNGEWRGVVTFLGLTIKISQEK